MSKFIPNYYSSEAMSSQWQRHLQTQAYVGDVTESIDRSIKAYNARARSLESTVRESTDTLTTAVMGASAGVLGG